MAKHEQTERALEYATRYEQGNWMDKEQILQEWRCWLVAHNCLNYASFADMANDLKECTDDEVNLLDRFGREMVRYAKKQRD